MYYVIFMLGYMSRVGTDYALYHYVNDPFIEEMLYDWCPLIWDGIPILCLLLFHFQNYKPHQHELIIRVRNSNDEALEMYQEEDNDEMLLIQDGLMG